jgi:hypothetical protein
MLQNYYIVLTICGEIICWIVLGEVNAYVFNMRKKPFDPQRILKSQTGISIGEQGWSCLG